MSAPRIFKAGPPGAAAGRDFQKDVLGAGRAAAGRGDVRPLEISRSCCPGGDRAGRRGGPGCRGEPPVTLLWGFSLLLPAAQTRKALFLISNPPFPRGQHVIERIPADTRSGGEGKKNWVRMGGAVLHTRPRQERTSPQAPLLCTSTAPPTTQAPPLTRPQTRARPSWLTKRTSPAP